MSRLSRTDPRWKPLRALVEKHSLRRGPVTLSSGRKSDFHFQLGQTILLPEGGALIGAIVVDFMRGHDLSCIGGPECGAIALVSATALVSHWNGWPVHAFFVRKEAKDHGAKQRIDGHLHMETKVLVADDVATEGKSLLVAVEAITEAGGTVRDALVVVDREEGAAELLADHGIELNSIFKKSDFNL